MFRHIPVRYDSRWKKSKKIPANPEEPAGNTSVHYRFLPQHFLNFLPLPQGQGSLRPTFTPLYM